ncbi:calcium-binding protein, partial [Vibrio sp.]|uniref:calcium-binding protein n=1 Tax=Vibrio sp. TaxID=678 RepID=UPI00312037E8
MSLTNDLQKELDAKLATVQGQDVGKRDFSVSEAIELLDSFKGNLASNLVDFPTSIPNHLSAGAAALGTAISNTYNHAKANVSSSDLYGLHSQKVVSAIDNSIVASGARAFNSTVSGMAVGVAVEVYSYSQSNSNDLELLNKKIIGVVGSAALGAGLAKTFIALLGGAATAAVSIPVAGLATLAAAIIAGAIATEVIESDWFNDLYDSAYDNMQDLFGWRPAPPPHRDPLILDLDGNGVSLTESTYFDHNANGIANRTQWVSSTDGLLALDRDGNGTIDSGRELFGDNTLDANGDVASDGYAALKAFDSNGDDVINQKDQVFDQLKVWVDANSDGVSQENELKTLKSLGVESIDLTHDNLHSQYHDTSGKSHQTQSVNLDVNNFDRRFVESLAVPESFSSLPDMRGTGTVRDLHEAMTLSGQLSGQIEQFASSSSRDEQVALSEKILFSWAKTSQYYDEHIPVFSGPEIDKVYAIEAFYGDKVPWAVSFGTNGAALALPTGMINNAYDSLVKMIYFELASQTRLKDYYGALTLSSDESGLSLSLEGALDLFSSRTLNPTLIADAMDFMSAMSSSSNSELTGFYTFISNALYGASDSDIEQFQSALEFNGIAISEVEGVKEVTFGEGTITFTEGMSTTEFRGSNGSDQIGGTDLDDVIHAGSSNDTVHGGVGNDELHGQDGNDQMLGGEGDDLITVNGRGSNTLKGGAGDDTLKVGRSTNYKYQHDVARHATNTLEGGVGNDRLEGSAGAETYVFNRGDGSDTINDYDHNSWSNTTGWNKTDRIVLGEGIRLEELRIRRDGNHMVLLIGGLDSGDSITIENAYSDGRYRIEELVFADGSKLVGSEMFELNMEGTAGDDTLSGTGFNETISGGAGSDTVHAGSGNDTVRGGAGNDELHGQDGNDQMLGGEGDDLITVNGRGSNTL